MNTTDSLSVSDLRQTSWLSPCLYCNAGRGGGGGWLRSHGMLLVCSPASLACGSVRELRFQYGAGVFFLIIVIAGANGFYETI